MNVLWFLLSADIPLYLFQQFSSSDYAFKKIMFCVLHKVSNVSISMSLKSYLNFLQLFGTKMYQCCFWIFSPSFASLPLLISPLISSPLPLLLLGQSSLCLLYLLSYFVKDLSGQPSDWPLGPAEDEAILILSGITAKLVVFSAQTFRHTDLHLHWHIRTGVKRCFTIPHQPKGFGSAKTRWMYTCCLSTCKF